jgi:hypothetical protein
VQVDNSVASQIMEASTQKENCTDTLVTMNRLSSEVFIELDRVMSLELMKTLDLQPAQIASLGMESHGKSTLLERHYFREIKACALAASYEWNFDDNRFHQLRFVSVIGHDIGKETRQLDSIHPRGCCYNPRTIRS